MLEVTENNEMFHQQYLSFTCLEYTLVERHVGHLPSILIA